MSSKSNRSNSTNKTSYDRFRKNRPIDVVNIVYLIFITSIFSVYMNNKYFDITGTRGTTFSHVSIVYAVILIMSYVLELFMLRYYMPELELRDIFYKDSGDRKSVV